MALFLDLHRNVVGATARDIADAHDADLREQARHDVRFRRYWFDEATETLLCLVEAPDAAAARAVHEESHGLIPDEVFRVLEGPTPQGTRQPPPGRGFAACGEKEDR